MFCVAHVMKKVLFVMTAKVSVAPQQMRYKENANFVNWIALHAWVCTIFPGSLTLKLLRELTWLPFRDKNQKVPIPDPPHVLKLVRSSLFNYWIFVSEYLVSLKLLSSARGDADEDIFKPIARELPRSCLCNKDQKIKRTWLPQSPFFTSRC